ncbi:DALR anticodon-binding domain-containing protein [Actinomadura sp. NPDC047616]|uniref:DALR anticodon-binding domain-containing protein n=1 Tax=Actinomadura sp. NPDC047616 TaxID=3155914 RepID=UPI0033C59E12
MTPADVCGALAAAAGADPGEVALRCVGPGLYASPVALRRGMSAQVVAERVAASAGVAEVRVDGGFLTVRVERPGDLLTWLVEAGPEPAPLERASDAPVWPEWPRTFENPGFCVRYAYARAAGVRRQARDLGVDAGEPVGLDAEEELRLIGVLGEFPARVRQGSRPLRRYLERLAGAYHDVHERCPALPKGEEKPGAVHAARVTLAEATRIALGSCLNTIGETPRERI